ncbi:ABC transporter permease [Pseudonocardia xinjiangensis]|uniref:ABC transporter permease n=1 Tax=Pseudonocardia xinjiangensis TaxID=75289 RepID=A0ABX1R5D1_9PSEU|nr:FtsX family ABC transporter permease [Pseudonocardia xinjiangensis]NMH75603.1 ABC transporter permease [Pseudonocardia xinjiangensis]
MRTVFLASLRTHARRYVAAAVAVIVSVAFVVVIGMLTSGARAGIMEGGGAPYRGADQVVAADSGDEPPRGPSCCPGTLDTSAAIELVERLGENASGLGRVLLPAHEEGGVPAGAGNVLGETTVGPIAAAEELRWQKLVSGRFPARTGEAVVHVWDARAYEVAVGDRIRVGEGATATDLDVVGLVESPSTWTQASVYVTWPQYVQWRDQPTFHVGSVAVRGEVGQLPDGMTVQPAAQYVAEGLAGLTNDVDTLALMGLLFAGVALFVSALVIVNTFSILFAQRLRDFALLRCVGATRRQVLGSVRREAAAVGVLASLTGTLAGVGLGYGLLPLINTLAPTTPMAAPAPPTPWLLGGFAVGLLVTSVESWLPTRHVVRVSPLAALRPLAAVDVHTATGRARLALAALLLVTGLALLGMAMIQDSTVLMVAGGASVFTGVLLFGPVLVPRLVRVAGALLGPAGRLATENAVRNPRRTATTTAALLVGVTLTTAVLTGMATWRAAMDEQRNRHLPIDAALVSLDEPVTTDLLDRVRRTPGVEQAVAVDGAVARITGFDAPIPVVTAPDAAQVARDGGAFAQAAPGTIRIDLGSFVDPSVRPGDRVTVSVGDRHAQLQVVSLGSGRAGMVAPETLAQLTGTPEPHVIWVRAAPGVDSLQLVDDLDGLADAAGAEVEDALQARAAGEGQLDLLTWSVLGLLCISVAIALIGIANTLGLSVLERAREHALLRALGLTRKQLRRMLATEAVLLSVAATVLGTTIGVAFAWVGYETFVKRALTRATMHIPWPSLGAVVLIAVLAGLLAAVLPARRAARVTPAAGLSLD